MTLQDLERLIRRIEEAMDRPPGDGILPRLAGDYAAACQSAAQRLRQCAAMVGAGDEHQALQLAEAAPALLDQLTLLSFRRSPEFRALCQAQNLQAVENFDIKPVRQLNELYAKGIDKDHALYREYRRAIMVNDEARALAVLRSITRLNQTDANAAAELARMENKLRIETIRGLEQLIRNNASAEQIVEVAEELEGVTDAQQSAAWIPAQTVRGAWLMEKARAALRRADGDELRRILENVRAISHLLSENDRRSIEELERWSVADAARRQEAASRRAAVVQLTETVARIEQEQLGSKKKAVDGLRRSSDVIEKAWRNVEHCRAEIAGDVGARAQKLRDTLHLEIERSLRASRRVAFAAVGIVLALCLAAAWIAYSRQAATVLANRIQEAIAERKVAETESDLAKAADEPNTPALATARKSAEAFLQQERAFKSATDQSIAILEARARAGFTNTAPENIAAEFEAARKADSVLALEFRAAAEVTLNRLDAQWQEYLKRQSEVRTTRLLPALDKLEATASTSLQYTRDADSVRRDASALLAELNSLRPLVDSPIPHLRPKQESIFRFETLEARARKFAADATNWFIAQRQLNEATNLAGYNNALQLLATNGFTPQGQRLGVAALAGLNLSDQALIAPLLLPNGSASALSEPPRISRVPDVILPAERDVQRRLRDDENIQNVSRLEIEIKALPAENPRRRRVVYLRGELQRRITRRAGQIYDPIENPSTLAFEAKEMSSLDYVVEEPTPTAEHELYDRAGLTRLIDSNSGKYQVSLLQALDDINLDRRATPLFRAWLFLQICQMIDAQPTQWGAIWSPAYAADRAELEKLGARLIQSGDWFVPTINARYAAPLYAHFDHATLHSYARQSAFFKRLLPKAAEIGLRVIGYLNGEGEPVINDTRAYGAVYAIAAPNQPPQMIFTDISPNRRPNALTNAMPFSPLMVFAGNSAELINATLQSLSYSATAVNLPESLPLLLKGTP